jgi:hypothetical protein
MKKAQIERRIALEFEVTKTAELFGTLYKSFKVGNFQGIIDLLTIVFDKIKLTFLKIYASIPGLSTASAIGIGEALFGPNFTKGESFRTIYSLGTRDEDAFKEFLDKEITDKDRELSKTRLRMDEANIKMEEQERIKTLKENNANLRKNNDVVSDNTKALREKNTTEESKRNVVSGALAEVYSEIAIKF